MPANIELSGVETSLIGVMSSETVLSDTMMYMGICEENDADYMGICAEIWFTFAGI